MGMSIFQMRDLDNLQKKIGFIDLEFCCFQQNYLIEQLTDPTG